MPSLLDLHLQVLVQALIWQEMFVWCQNLMSMMLNVSSLCLRIMHSHLEWPTRYWAQLVQSAFTGKAKKVCSSLSLEQLCNYEEVKSVVLAAYELVPEAYRQKFRSWKRRQGQTYVEYFKEKELMFDRWYRSLGKRGTLTVLERLCCWKNVKTVFPLRSRPI